jgi:transcriptional regulator CtsR
MKIPPYTRVWSLYISPKAPSKDYNYPIKANFIARQGVGSKLKSGGRGFIIICRMKWRNVKPQYCKDMCGIPDV